jgi:hypothetical protein
MLRYLSKLTYGIKILWCCLVWYVYFAVMYFEPNTELWVAPWELVGLI